MRDRKGGSAMSSEGGREPAAKRQPSPEEWAAIWKLFDALCDLPEREREQRLRAARAGPLVCDEVRSLLRSSEGQGFLDQSLEREDAEPVNHDASLATGTMVGQFRILHPIGRGGMGEVYLAQRAQGGFDQRVALKLLRAEAVTGAALFEFERGILADLEHPGIARLIDGGKTEDGRPFMALEYVEGEAIDDWCEQRHASLLQRLKLFLDVCDAVSYAHGRLVVHLDLKPNNILVDREGRARLLDFGIARIVGEGNDLSRAKTLLTPDYAAPEQLENKAVTVATDVYALGAVLFRLLTGRGPWQSEEAALPATVLRILRGDPPPPSSVPSRGEAWPIPARAIAGDLDAIVVKAMRPEPADRYASVADLSADIRRHLAHRPVRARGESRPYRALRFLRRNRVAFGSAVAVALAVIAGVAGIVLKAREAAWERDIAREQATRQRAAAGTMLFLLRDAYDEKKARSTSVGEMMAMTTRNLVQSLPAQSPDIAVRIETLASIDIATGNWRAAKPLLLGALSRGIERTDPAGAARLKVELAVVYLREGDLKGAGSALDQAEHVWRTDPDRFLKEAAETIDARAYWLRTAGKLDQAVTLLKGNLPDAQRAYQYYYYNLPWRYSNLATYLGMLGRLDEADRLLQRGEEFIEESDSDRRDGAIVLYVTQAGIALQKGDLGRAGMLMRRGITAQRRLYGRTLTLVEYLASYGRLLVTMNRCDEALRVLDEASQIAATFDPSNRRLLFQIDTSKIQALAELGRVDEAERLLAPTAGSVSDIPGRKMSEGLLLRARAALRIAQGRWAEAATDLDAATLAFKMVPAPTALADIARLRAKLNRLKSHGGSTPAPETSGGARSVR